MVLVGIDLGTSSVKLLAIDEKGTVIGDVSKEYPVEYPKDNWAEQNPKDWWEQTKNGLIELKEKFNIPSDGIKGISFSGQMHGLVMLDASNEVIHPAILWCDQRTGEECEIITNHFGSAKLSELVGNKALTGFTAPKILWVKRNRPEIYAQIKHILLPKDYVRFCMTGEYATDVSDASGMLLLDVANRTWSEEMLAFLEIDKTWLPSLHESYEVTGKMSEQVKSELGLTGDILVVAGAGDQAAGAIGTGTVEEGIVSVTLGTSGVVFAAHGEYAVDEDNRLHAFCHANGKYHSMGVMLSAASSLKWWVDEMNPGVTFETLLEEAANISPSEQKVVFLPYLMGERTPYSDVDARGAFIGMSMSTTRGSLTRAVLEGVAFGLKDSLEILKDIGVPINEIRVIGGGAKSPLWKQILADIFGLAISEINTNQGGALGAAILAGVGVGAFETVDKACSDIIKVTNSLSPIEANVLRYETLYPLFQRLYKDVFGWYKAAAAL